MELFLVGLLTFVATFVGTVTGFGTSTLMVPVLAFFLPLPVTLLFVGILHWFSDIWKMLLFRNEFRWKLILLFGIPGIVASYVGASFVLSFKDETLMRMLGVFLTGYTLYLFIRPSFRIPNRPETAMVGGAMAGLCTGFFGIGGAIHALFLSAYNLPKAVFISTIGAIAFATDLTRVLTYAWNGIRISDALLIGLIVLVPVSFLGAKAAQMTLVHVPEKRFRLLVLGFLFLLGTKLVVIP
jgi:uncharacterized membrane protein YfcA